MKNIITVIKKQIRDTFKNKTVLIQFVMFPALTLIMENAVKFDDMPENFFAKLFSVMYVGMAPLTSAAAIISEEKEKNTLRVLMMANVKPVEYLAGITAYVWSLCMAGALVISTCFSSEELPFYLAVMGAGFVISILIGSCVGIFAKNQMTSTSLVMPVMMVLSFAPMLAMFNDNIKKVAFVFFTQQIRESFGTMSFDAIGTKGISVICINAALVFVLFFITFRKKGLQ
ncbi:MAG: ABC transporter permease [Lachnospiraceae bacterium]|nr:ABC transporter permease [Lachnospiraceae bacterium]